MNLICPAHGHASLIKMPWYCSWRGGRGTHLIPCPP